MSTNPTKTLSKTDSFEEQLIKTVDGRDANGRPLSVSRKGMAGDYYELPDSPDYVLRLNHGMMRNKTMEGLLAELHALDLSSLKLSNHTNGTSHNHEGFPLRHNSAPSPHATLKHYSALTPARHVMVGANIGQTLMASRDNVISVLRRQPGIPLLEHIKKTSETLGMLPNLRVEERNRIRMKALTQVMRDIVGMTTIDAEGKPEIANNPYVPLFEQACALADLGYEPNFYPDAIFIDMAGKKLGLVNQLSHRTSRYNQADDISIKTIMEVEQKRVLSEFRIDCLPKDQDCADYKYSLWQFEELLSSASKTAIENHHARANAIAAERWGNPDYVAPPPLLAFADVKDTSAIALTKPSHVMMQRLRDLQTSPIKTGNYF